MKNLLIISISLLAALPVCAQNPARALAASMPPAEYIALAGPQSQASGVVVARNNAATLIKFIEKYMTRPSSFVTTSRNPFVTNFGGGQATGSITAKEIWESVKRSLPIAGVNINKEDASRSAVVLGDAILRVGVPLPDYILDSPVKVLLVSVSDEEAVFRILMPDPNRLETDEGNIKSEDFSIKFERELIPTIRPTSRFRVVLPDARKKPPAEGPGGAELQQ